MFERKTRWADCAAITSAQKSLTKRYATPAGGRLLNRSRPRWSRGLRSGRKVAAMRATLPQRAWWTGDGMQERRVEEKFRHCAVRFCARLVMGGERKER